MPELCPSVWPLVAVPVADAATVLRKYEYFALIGRTAADLDRELYRRGPILQKTGQRHPGHDEDALHQQDKIWFRWQELPGGRRECRRSRPGLPPRWKQRRTAKPDLALIWDTLSADIKRHEESHIVIARTAAGDMERAIKALPWRSDCTAMKADIDALTTKLMRKHDLAQIQFDRVEAVNFDSRFERLLVFRLQREFAKSP